MDVNESFSIIETLENDQELTTLSPSLLLRAQVYVVESKLSKSASGFLIEVLQKTDLANPIQCDSQTSDVHIFRGS